MEIAGIVQYALLFGIMAAIYAILSLGLNVQWGYTGLMNIGVAGFFATGAYTSAILTKPATAAHVGGMGLPFVVGLLGAVVLAGFLALVIGLITLRLRDDYLAIATIGIAETVRLILTNESWLARGVWGLTNIPQPMRGALPVSYNWIYIVIVLLALATVYLLSERALRSPWGRILRAIREDEAVVTASGKDVFRFKLEGLVLGSAMMGLAGALFAHFTGYISPQAFEPMQATFLVWVMLIIGGSGNNRGAVVGAFVVWGIWTLTELVTTLVPAESATQAAALRVILIGLLLELVLITRPQGILGEERLVSRSLLRQERAASQKPEGAVDADVP